METNAEARKLVSEMTLYEKASLCSGEDYWHLKSVPRVGIPESIMVCDGPHGLRKQQENGDRLGINASVPATCFPAECLTACSFDRALLYEIGAAIGEECRQEEVAVVLGPGANCKRSPLCGRNFEYFSEDPLLSGEMAAAFIEGVQSQSVGASLKHYAANNQEKLRMTVESVVDERALMEIYLTAFEIAVRKARPWTVMCSYNKLKGEYASDNRWLLTDVLRDTWGYQGMVVSDWGAVNDRVAGVRAGMDLEMPAVTRDNDLAVAAAVESGALPEADVDACATRVTELILKSRARKPFTYDASAHHALARRAAAASAVLLKNEGALLPLSPGAHVAAIGAFAVSPRFQGAGSSKINPLQVDGALDVLTAAGVAVEYAEGYDPATDAPDETRIAAACEIARGKDAAIVFAGLPDRYESEGFDRAGIDMPESHVSLIRRVAAVNPHTVVVLMCGSVVACPWADEVPAILLTYLGGEAACAAAADLLTGKINPAGKLAESWPNALHDNPSYAYFPGYPRAVEYRESVFVGYRYYDTAEKPVRWPFGYGLSYTSFTYANLALDKTEMRDSETLTLSFDVTNTGDRAGGEIVEVYVAPQTSGIFRPAQELRAFDRLYLAPGETKRASFTLARRAFAYYHAPARDWAVESGVYEIRVGASSRDIRLTQAVSITAERPLPAPDYRESAPCYYTLSNGVANVPDEAFAALVGKPLPAREMQKGEKYTVNSTMHELRRCWIGRRIANIIQKMSASYLGDDEDMNRMMESMVSDAPLRMLLMAGGDTLTPRMLTGLVELLNGRAFSGLWKLLSKR